MTKCDVFNCENNGVVLECGVWYCVKHYLEKEKRGVKHELKPKDWESGFLRLEP